jgi:hypothetical protein
MILLDINTSCINSDIFDGDLVHIPNVKKIRAEVIRDRLPPGISRVICLSCGNAVRSLEETITGARVVGVDPRSPVVTTREITIDELWRYFGPESFNATSGYLPLDWLEEIGQRIYKIIPSAPCYFVPCGSGETMMALSFFVPIGRMVGVTATYPPIEMVGPLARWLRKNAEIRHAGRVDSVAAAMDLVAREDGVALCWES